MSYAILFADSLDRLRTCQSLSVPLTCSDWLFVCSTFSFVSDIATLQDRVLLESVQLLGSLQHHDDLLLASDCAALRVRLVALDQSQLHAGLHSYGPFVTIRALLIAVEDEAHEHVLKLAASLRSELGVLA